jgi:hypothetical protein
MVTWFTNGEFRVGLTRCKHSFRLWRKLAALAPRSWKVVRQSKPYRAGSLAGENRKVVSESNKGFREGWDCKLVTLTDSSLRKLLRHKKSAKHFNRSLTEVSLVTSSDAWRNHLWSIDQKRQLFSRNLMLSISPEDWRRMDRQGHPLKLALPGDELIKQRWLVKLDWRKFWNYVARTLEKPLPNNYALSIGILSGK